MQDQKISSSSRVDGQFSADLLPSVASCRRFGAFELGKQVFDLPMIGLQEGDRVGLASAIEISIERGIATFPVL
jgi:hypothetical protein